MPILKKQRWELFAQEIAKGETATKAYETAGFSPSRKNASRLRAREDVGARVMELQGLAARSAVITVQSICQELDAAVAVARERGQAQAMVSASALRAKLAGLMVERVEVAAVDAFGECRTYEEVLVVAAREFSKDHELTPAELNGFAKVLREAFAAIDQYLAACKAKLVQPMTAQDRECIERKRVGLIPRPNGNGSVKA